MNTDGTDSHGSEKKKLRNLCKSVQSVKSAFHSKEAEMLHEEITGAIIRAFYKAYNTLGYGFLEKVYENALAWPTS